MHLYCNPADSFYMPADVDNPLAPKEPRYSLVVCLELFIELGDSQSISEINHAQRLSETHPYAFEPSCCSTVPIVHYTVPFSVAKYTNMRIFNRKSKEFEELADGGYNWDDAVGEIKEYPTTSIGGGGHKEIIVMDIFPDLHLTDAEGYKYANEVTIEPSSKFVVSETDCHYRRPTILLDMFEDYSEISLECINVGQSTKRCCASFTCYPPYEISCLPAGDCSGPCAGVVSCTHCGEGEVCCEQGVSQVETQCLNDVAYDVMSSSSYAAPPTLLFKIRDKLKGVDYVQLPQNTFPNDPMYALEADNISVDLNNSLNFKVVYNKKRGTLPTYPVCASYTCPPFAPYEVFCSANPSYCDDSGGDDPGQRPPGYL